MKKEQAYKLIKLARNVVFAEIEKEAFKIEESLKREFCKEQGVFTTLKTYPEKRLRGCIGIPYPIYPLWQAVLSSARDAAFHDPRFEPLTEKEFYKVTFELSLLTKPEKIKGNKQEILREIEIGRHGLIVEKGGFKGLLLPQVAIEWKFDKEKFLEETCLKTGLPQNAWQDKETQIYRFSGTLIEEIIPLGEIEIKALNTL